MSSPDCPAHSRQRDPSDESDEDVPAFWGSPGDGAAQKDGGATEEPVFKKPRISEGELPEGLPTLEGVCCKPPALSHHVPRLAGDLYSAKLNVDRVLSGRCVEGIVYGQGEDGCVQFMFELAANTVRAENPNIYAALNTALEMGNAEITVKWPQMSRLDHHHGISLTPGVAEVHGGRLLTSSGHQYKQVATDTVVQTASLHARFLFNGTAFVFTFSKKGATWGPDGGSEIWHSPVSQESAASVFDVSLWDQAKATEARGKNAGAWFSSVSYYDEVLLKAVLDESPHWWTDAMLVNFSSVFVSRSVGKRGRGGEAHELHHCNKETGMWSQDTGFDAFNRCLAQLLLQAAHLPDKHGELYFGRLYDACRDSTHSIARKAESTVGCKNGEYHYDEFHAAKECRALHPGTGGGLFKHAVVIRNLFMQRVLNNDVKFDDPDTRIFCFSDGYCYDVVKCEKRRIRPEDYVARNTGYPYPTEADEEMIPELLDYLAEIFPKPSLLRWFISMDARCLEMKAQARALFESGHGGEGKNLFHNLAHLAFSVAYSLTMDKALLCPGAFENSEGPKSGRLQIKNKLRLFVDEPKNMDEEWLKALTGGSEISARGMRENTGQFKPTHGMLVVSFNIGYGPKFAKETDALKRRNKAVQFKNGFERFDNKEEADRHAPRLKEIGKFPMYPAKYERIMSLYPAYMSLMLQMHKKANAPGGSWPEEPPEIAEWTRELYIQDDDATNDEFEEWFTHSYARCGCVPEDPECMDNLNLVDSEGKKCIHYVNGSDVMEKLGKNSILKKQVKGKGRSNAPIYAQIAKINMGPPGQEVCLKVPDQKHPVIYGLVPNAALFVQAAHCKPCY